ncbi:MAG: Ldh family oxidoreductase, partial [FCB group bacterium]|nr:Ldh family oxidoreductase [FCB group bacterium]
KNVAIDNHGNSTSDPNKLLEGGGLLPIAGRKGSGLAFIIELLGGALTGSRVGFSVSGDWGSFYILLDPALFRPLADFKKDVATAIDELKRTPKMTGFTEIYFPGEQSYQSRKRGLEEGRIEISENVLRKLLSIPRGKE